MFKATPNPPETDPQELDEAAKRAIDHYLDPKPQAKKKKPSGQLFTVVDGVDTESLLANLSETLASADAMVSDLALDIKGSLPQLDRSTTGRARTAVRPPREQALLPQI
ncbi:DUF6124 family protein [Pseudomonas brassicacearum]|uniref:DUF6124 family protein n=1 Tax=Pseudomonas brassicacearum TaxID=930166 RepID=UPI001D5BF9CC|nr:hypothetical protein [Pseudomonas brassicacearum]CAH0250007.1 hypothetical protein SRABI06_03117 [Pseudomonas brassicacearum]